MKTSAILYGLSLVAGLGNVAALDYSEPLESLTQRQAQDPDSLGATPSATFASVGARDSISPVTNGSQYNAVLTEKFIIMIDFEQKYQELINGTSRDSATQVELVAKALRTLTDTLVDDAFAHVTGWVKPNELNDMAALWNNLYLNTWGMDGFIVQGLTNLHADLCDNLTAMSINFKMFNETTHASMTAPTALQMIPNTDGTTPPEWFTEIGEEVIGANWMFGTFNRAIDRCNSYVNGTVGQNETVPANATVGQNQTVPAGQSLDPTIDTVLKLLFKFEQKYHLFMEGHHDTHGQAETVAFKARDLVEGLGTAASSVKTFTGNVSNDDLTHLEKSYNDASGDTKTYLNDTDYIALPKFLEQRVCDRVQDAGTKFDDFASAVAFKLNEAVRNATSDTDNMQLSVDRIMGRSDAIIGGLNHAASKCYNLLNVNSTTSAPATNSSAAASTTTMAGNIPGEIVVSVHNTVTGPCSCGWGLTPRTAAAADSDNDPADPVTSTWFNPNPMTSAAADASMVTIRISDTVTVPCVCETATAHHHGHPDETTTTTRHHSTTVTASPTSTGSAAVMNVDGPSLWLVVAQFLFLLCLPSVWAWAVLRRFGF